MTETKQVDNMLDSLPGVSQVEREPLTVKQTKQKRNRVGMWGFMGGIKEWREGRLVRAGGERRGYKL